MVTLTPSRFTGIWPPTKSAPCQGRDVPAKLLPLITTHVLGAIVEFSVEATCADMICGGNAQPVPTVTLSTVSLVMTLEFLSGNPRSMARFEPDNCRVAGGAVKLKTLP